MTKISIENIVDKHKNKTGWVVANGPSTLDVLPLLFQTKENVLFVCNEFDEMLKNISLSFEELQPDYWVVANSVLTVKSYCNNFNKMLSWGGKLLYADSVDTTSNPESFLTVDYIPYDQRHFDKKVCQDTVKHCCSFNKHNIDSGRLTIQEELKEYTKYNKHYGTGSTVALHMLAFAILTGCNPINIVGVDLNYSLGYFDKTSQNNDSFGAYYQDIIDDFKTINSSTKNINVKVINHSKNIHMKEIFQLND